MSSIKEIFDDLDHKVNNKVSDFYNDAEEVELEVVKSFLATSLIKTLEEVPTDQGIRAVEQFIQKSTESIKKEAGLESV